MNPSGQRERKIEPEYLGPLTDRPLGETGRSGGTADLFAGASAFLGGRHQRRRKTQWSAVTPLAERLLRPDEHILYVAHGMQVPPTLHMLALGALALSYHQVVLVFTDTRLIEVLLGVRGKKAETRVRSFPWASVCDMGMRLGKLRLAPAQGKKQAWRIPLRGDRKLLKLLEARLRSRLLQEGAGMAQRLPLWYCPTCGATVPENPLACNACRTTFRSSRLAALYSMAFPGAGLFYAGHPFLAAADFLGELLLYSLFLVLMLEAEPGSVKIAAGIGAFFFIMTKLESIHLSQILVARTKPEPESRRSRFNQIALVGGLASLVLIGGAFPLAGAGRAVVDRDLDVGGQDSSWQGTRNVSEWTAFADDPTARSQWLGEDEVRVTLFAYPQQMLDSASEFRNGVRKGLQDQGVVILQDDEEVPPPFHGFRFITRAETEEGETVSAAQYFVLDQENRDIHQAVAAIISEDETMAVEVVRDFLSHARWIGAAPPEKPTVSQKAQTP